MKALGLVETKGLVAAIEASDVMLKTAEVRLTQKEIVGGGLVTVMVSGDVGAVKTSVAAAASAVTKLEATLLVTTHVIPRPDESLRLFEKGKEVQEINEKSMPTIEEAELTEAEETALSDKNLEEPITDASQDSETSSNPIISGAILAEWGKTGKTAEMEAALTEMKVIDLRKLAKKQSNFAISKKDVHKANKEQLVSELCAHFQNG